MKREVEELFTWGCGGLSHHRGLPISKRTAACGLAIVPPPPSHATTSSLHHRLFTFCRSHAVRAFASLTRSYYVPSAAASSPKTPSSTSVCLCVCVCACVLVCLLSFYCAFFFTPFPASTTDASLSHLSLLLVCLSGSSPTCSHVVFHTFFFLYCVGTRKKKRGER